MSRPTSFDVRLWSVSKRTWASRQVTYRVRWVVAGQTWHDSFKTRALADSFRSELLCLARQGEPFDIETGQPVSRVRHEEIPQSWYAHAHAHACAYVDMKWPRAAGKSRQGIAESLATVTPALLVSGKSRPGPTAMRALLYGWSFNARARAAGPPPEDLVRAHRWLGANTAGA